MISTDFAPNESWDDAWLSIKILFMPWLWKKGDSADKVRKWFRSKYLVSSIKYQVYFFLSGRSALYYLLKSFNLPKESEVVIQAFTCEAVVLPIIELGLKPVYVDIEPETYSMSYRELTNRLSVNCRVLILQHTFGLTPKFRNQILKLAKEHKLIIIEDLAHGFSKQSTINNQQSYFLLSFGRSKMLSSVFGGAIVSFNNKQLAINNLEVPSLWFIFRCLLYKPLTMLIKSTYDFYLGKILHKMLDKFGLLVPEITSKEKSGDYDKIFNKAYPNALSCLLLHQLKKFDQIKKNRAKICKIYSRHLKKNNQQLSINNWSLIRFPLLVNNRSEVLAKARKYNIFLGTWYDQVVAPKDLDISRVGYKPGSCPTAEEICKKIINLPTNVSEKEAEKIIKILVLILPKA